MAIVVNLVAIVSCGILAITHEKKKVRLGFLILLILNLILLLGNLGLYEIPKISVG